MSYAVYLLDGAWGLLRATFQCFLGKYQMAKQVCWGNLKKFACFLTFKGSLIIYYYMYSYSDSKLNGGGGSKSDVPW